MNQNWIKKGSILKTIKRPISNPFLSDQEYIWERVFIIPIDISIPERQGLIQRDQVREIQTRAEETQIQGRRVLEENQVQKIQILEDDNQVREEQSPLSRIQVEERQNPPSVDQAMGLQVPLDGNQVREEPSPVDKLQLV